MNKFDKWVEANGWIVPATDEWEVAQAAWNAALDEAARVCQSHEPKDFTVAGICTRARCAQVILALKEK